MTPARSDFIKRMNKVADFLDSGRKVKVAIEAGNLSKLLRLAAGTAVLTDMLSDVSMKMDDEDMVDVETHKLNELLKTINAEVLAALED